MLIFTLIFLFLSAYSVAAGGRGRPKRPPGGRPRPWHVPTISRDQLLGDKSRYLGSSRGFDTSAPPQTREYSFHISLGDAPIGGIARQTILVNGMSPGPIVEANVGDRIVATVYNGLPNGTSVHWHGMRQVGSNFMDGTASFSQCPIPPGWSGCYNFIVQDVGTYWWHSHGRLQYSDGMFGPIITHSKEESAHLPEYDDEYMLVLGDVYNTPSEVLFSRFSSTTGIDGEPGDEPTPDGGHINGVSQAHCAYMPSNAASPDTDGSDDTDDPEVSHSGSTTAQTSTQSNPLEGPQPTDGPTPPPTNATIYPDTNDCGDIPTTYWNVTLDEHKTYRLRLLNAGSYTDQTFSIDGHELTVVELDGIALEPYRTKRIRLAVSQRASVLIDTKTPGAHWIRSALGTDQMEQYFAPNVSNVTLAILRYGFNVGPDTMPSISPEEAVSSTGTEGHGIGAPMDGEPAVVPSAPTWSLNAATVGPYTRLYPAEVLVPPPSMRTVDAQFEMLMTEDNTMRAFINNHSWVPMANNAAIFIAQDGYQPGNDGSVFGSQFNILTTDPSEVIDLILHTNDTGPHPFHFHGHNFWILAQGLGTFNGDTATLPTDNNPLYGDVVVVPPGGHVVIRFTTSNPGAWALHCHMQWHMMVGLMMSVTSQPQEMMKWCIPTRWWCAADQTLSVQLYR
jgi:iron transport multicopper oxidase